MGSRLDFSFRLGASSYDFVGTYIYDDFLDTYSIYDLLVHKVTSFWVHKVMKTFWVCKDTTLGYIKL